MMETTLAPIARWMSTPKIRVRTGVTRRPPPMPTIEPKIPAATEVRNMKKRKKKSDSVVDHA